MIDVTNSDGNWHVTLNRPDKANALTRGMLKEVADIAAKAHIDPDLRTFVITGAGDRVFCAGADVSDGEDMFEFTRDQVWIDASQNIADLPCLTIAGLNGTLAGGGFALALACDMRIATPQAKFFYPVLKRGFLPQPNDVHRMTKLVGPARAKLILMAGQKLLADEALRIGLIDRIVDLEAFGETLASIKLDATMAKPQSIAAIKRLFDDLSAEELNDCYEAAYFDNAEAITKITGR
ncbi:MAG: enoyl-CoA hydratase/isomerase family protein [Amylibacter sp.]|nr:enoyl-CoA hydratase/isomerase family protein [Amylibacter sp.]MDG2000129.1 enoyl-CoA hydratase/isomerase family protein [Amylibacter sp.]